MILSFIVFYYPNVLGHPDNNIPANPLVTPLHIQPEFYFLPFYAILRAVPNKTLGVVFMFSAILIFMLLPLSKPNLRSNKYKPIFNILYFIFIFNFLFLMWLGAKPINQPYILLSQLSTVVYFSYVILLLIF